MIASSTNSNKEAEIENTITTIQNKNSVNHFSTAANTESSVNLVKNASSLSQSQALGSYTDIYMPSVTRSGKKYSTEELLRRRASALTATRQLNFEGNGSINQNVASGSNEYFDENDFFEESERVEENSYGHIMGPTYRRKSFDFLQVSQSSPLRGGMRETAGQTFKRTRRGVTPKTGSGVSPRRANTRDISSTKGSKRTPVRERSKSRSLSPTKNRSSRSSSRGNSRGSRTPPEIRNRSSRSQSKRQNRSRRPDHKNTYGFNLDFSADEEERCYDDREVQGPDPSSYLLFFAQLVLRCIIWWGKALANGAVYTYSVLGDSFGGVKNFLYTVGNYCVVADTWLLSKFQKRRCCALLFWILLVPFLVCGLYTIRDRGCETIMAENSAEQLQDTWILSKISSIQDAWPALLGYISLRKSSPVTGSSTSGQSYYGGSSDSLRGSTENTKPWPSSGAHYASFFNNFNFFGTNDDAEFSSEPKMRDDKLLAISESELEQKIRAIFKDMYGEKRETVDIPVNVEGLGDSDTYREDIADVTKMIVKEELRILESVINDKDQLSSNKYQDVTNQQIQSAAKIRDIEGKLAAVVGESQEVQQQLRAAKEKVLRQDEESREHTEKLIGDLEKKLVALQTELTSLSKSQRNVLSHLTECCKSDSSLGLLIRSGVREQLSTFVTGVMNNQDSSEGDSHSSTNLHSWLHNSFPSKNNIDDKLASLAAKTQAMIKRAESNCKSTIEGALATGAFQQNTYKNGNGSGSYSVPVDTGVKDMCQCNGFSKLAEDQVKHLIRQSLLVFSADKTGMPDFALESSGGSIINTRCSETYHHRTAQMSILGIPLWYASNSPRTVIQPEINPGQCWAIKGDHGYLVIQLAGMVKPTAFSYEHISKQISPSGNIDSAPKDFTVKGLDHEHDKVGYVLGTFQYNKNGEPLQYFYVTDPHVRAFPIVELIIESNQGNKEYTCLYRFRVHGELV